VWRWLLTLLHLLLLLLLLCVSLRQLLRLLLVLLFCLLSFRVVCLLLLQFLMILVLFLLEFLAFLILLLLEPFLLLLVFLVLLCISGVGRHGAFRSRKVFWMYDGIVRAGGVILWACTRSVNGSCFPGRDDSAASKSAGLAVAATGGLP
jgi:hypothetical protein